MQGLGNDRKLQEDVEGNDLEGSLVGGFENDGARRSGVIDLQPTRSADAPAIAGLQPGETELRHGR